MTETDSPDGRIASLIEKLTLQEKIDLVHGDRDPAELATGYLPANDRVGIPSLSLVDGPMGVRAVTATAFPASIALAAAWDTDLAREQGETLGTEVRGADQDVLLAPGCNIIRVPECGRAFEYYSEDPHLSSRLAVATIESVQSAGAMATAKHYVANNQERQRHAVSAEIDERTLREIYLPAFEAAVKEADVASVMASYNRINGTYATEHERLLTDILKDEWGFDGFVVSDWWATTDAVAAAHGGLDLDMPGVPVHEWQESESRIHEAIGALPDAAPKGTLAELAAKPWLPDGANPNLFEGSVFEDPLREAIEGGKVPETAIDEKIARTLSQMDRFGMFDDEQPAGSVNDPAHETVARRVAQRGTVLLQNDGVLPLDEDLDSIAVLGPNAEAAKIGGGGSSEVDPTAAISPLDGIRERTDSGTTVTFERGVERIEEPHDEDDGALGFSVPDAIDDALSGDDEEPSIDAAARAAGSADVAVVVVQDNASESEDRSLWLPNEQDRLVAAVADVAEKTVVVCNTAGPVRMPWAGAVDAIVETWYPGQEDGHVTASVLFGDVDPSGRLPVTFARRTDHYPASTEAQYPGIDLEAEYSEGVFVGYRHFDNADIEPLFPFGHGLSYTDFEYTDVSVESGDGPAATVEVTVENVGGRDGYEVVQAYLGQDDPSVERPPEELAAFESVELAAGEETTVTLSIEERDFAYYDEDGAAWTVDDGEYTVSVGRSSRNIVATETITVADSTIVE
ncbi:beta-glucosidase [Halorhabdus sp. CUG00001]|uniref:beta-glucosidase family protein n=1 Tax=Halorhabdus sp. CUG00001 TaxID=2600297 RepID=UPI00131E02EC|nr:glycoside hydrolase family 3 C-terminal domain-containing protein [Halorhabdus sp. CUG00001]